MSRAHVFDLHQRPGSKSPWYVRWRVDGRGASRQFRTKAAARDFHARLVLAADAGEPFDSATKLPRTWSPTKPDRTVTCYDTTVAFMAHKWGLWAATTRRSAVETLVTAIVTLTDSKPAPDLETAILGWLRQVALIDPTPDADDLGFRCRGELDRAAHAWLLKHSLPIQDLDFRRAESVLDAFAYRQDGIRAAASVISRKRTQFGGYIKFCVRRQHLSADPLLQSDWKPPLLNREIDREILFSPADVDRLLHIMPDTGRLGPRLVAFFAALFYAGLRPSEALALTPADLELPPRGWGRIAVRQAVTSTGRRYTDDGQRHQQRQLKWRSVTSTRHVPIPPILVRHLTEHLRLYRPPSGDLLFPNLAGNPLDPARYLRVFSAAKAIAFTSDDPLRRATPYSLRHANATVLLNAGVPIADAARRLGHSPDVLLSVYAGVMTTDEAISNSRVDALLSFNAPTNRHAAPTAVVSTNKDGETS